MSKDKEKPEESSRRENDRSTGGGIDNAVIARELVTTNDDIVRANDPRTRTVRRGISLVSWASAFFCGSIAYFAGLPAGTVLLLIISGIGYSGSEVLGALVISRMDRLEGGRLLAIAERVGQVEVLGNIGNRICLFILSCSLGTRHARPASIANSAERARIQDRGVEFCALLSALGYGGLSFARFGITGELINSLVIFTTVISGGRGYLVSVRRGAELSLADTPYIRRISNPVERRARVILRSLYAPTTIGDFLVWCGVVGRPLINAGLMLPLGLIARFLPKTAKNIITGIVGMDVISDVHEAFICADLLSHNILPENVEAVARKKTLKYKITKTLLYSLIPFITILSIYFGFYYRYDLEEDIPKEATIAGCIAVALSILIVVWCNFEKLDRFLSRIFSRCGHCVVGIFSKKEDQNIAMQMAGDALDDKETSEDAGVEDGRAEVNVERSTEPPRPVRMGHVKRRSSAHAIFEEAQEDLRSVSGRASPMPGAAERATPLDASVIDIAEEELVIDTDTFNDIMSTLKMNTVGETRQGRSVYIIDVNQHSDRENVQAVIEKDKGSKILFIVDTNDHTTFYTYLQRVVSGSSYRGVQIDMNRIDFLFDREYGYEVDESAFARAIEQLKLIPMGQTENGRIVYVIEPGQTSLDRHVQRLLQLESRGERSCFIACSKTSQTVYCPVVEVFGENNPNEIIIKERINSADRVFDRRVRLEQTRGAAAAETETIPDDVEMDRRKSVRFEEEERSESVFNIEVFDPETRGRLRRESPPLRRSSKVEELDDEFVEGDFNMPRISLTRAGTPYPSDMAAAMREPFDANDEGSSRINWKQKVASAISSTVSSVGSWFRWGKKVSSNEPVEVESRGPYGAAQEEPHVLVNDCDAPLTASDPELEVLQKMESFRFGTPHRPSNEGDTEEFGEAVAFECSGTEDSSSDESKKEGENDESDQYDENESESNSGSREIQWFYDDRKSIDTKLPNPTIFQDNTPKGIDLDIMKSSLDLLREKMEKEAQEHKNDERKTIDDIIKEIEERNAIKSQYEEEESSEDDSDKTIEEKMLEGVTSFSSSKIFPKKYDIPDEIDLTPPQAITFASMSSEKIPSIPFYEDVSSYFYQAVDGVKQYASYGMDKVQNSMLHDVSPIVFLGFALLSGGIVSGGGSSSVSGCGSHSGFGEIVGMMHHNAVGFSFS